MEHATDRRRPPCDRPDHRVVADATRVITVPRRDPADSFVLHAPLELAARARLLPHVARAGRALARARIDDLAARYEAAGEPVADPASTTRVARTSTAGASPDPERAAVDLARRLVDAIDAGDLDDVDATADALAARVAPGHLAALLADDLSPRLAAAGHAPILLWLLRRADPTLGLSSALLRGPARELARHPEWRFRWMDRTGIEVGDAVALAHALAATPHLGLPGSDFVFPTMHQVDPAAAGPTDRPDPGAATVPLGVAADVLAGVVAGDGTPASIAARAATVRRLAAWTMLLEPPDHSPYGWTHALTIPQAVLGVADAVADPGRALAVAASHLVGFRAALARRPLDLDDPAAAAFPGGAPGVTTVDGLADALTADPSAAAAAVWFAPEALLADVATEVATRASARRDAHLVKYTLACLDAAATSPDDRRLFLAAAASLVAWWHAIPEPDDPLLEWAVANSR